MKDKKQEINRIVDGFRDKIIQSLQHLISIKSVKEAAQPGMPFGPGPDQALRCTLDLAEGLGFTVKNIGGYAGHAETGEGTETLGILAHLDVVPAGDRWTYPPFGGEIHNGRIYGRGAMDDKGPAIGALYAVRAVLDAGYTLKKKVRLIFGLDEESGWEDMKVYFSRESAPDFSIIPDGDYPVIYAEKGILNVRIRAVFPAEDCVSACIVALKGGLRPNMVPDLCTCSFERAGDSEKILTHLHSFNTFSGYDLRAGDTDAGEILITAQGISAHGSTPAQGENAISKMLAYLSTLGLGSSAMEQFILKLNDMLGSDTTGEALGIAGADAASGALTVNLGTMALDQREAEAVLNIRYPVTWSWQEIHAKIAAALKAPGISTEVAEHLPPLYLPKDHFLIQHLLRVYEEQTGQKAEPLAIGGGTYARAVPNAAAFGAQFPGRPDLAHQRDEYIEIEDLMLHTKLYAHAIAALCTEDARE